jgi:hypothetical protein
VRAPKLNVRELKRFTRVRDAKEVENFFFDLGQYFKMIGITEEYLKVDTAATYLVDDAKLWWRVQVAEMEVGRLSIETWEDMKATMNQFFLLNAEYAARRKLRELRHTGMVREYVNFFITCLLQIEGIPEVDKLFSFTEGLKPWARHELNR